MATTTAIVPVRVGTSAPIRRRSGGGGRRGGGRRRGKVSVANVKAKHNTQALCYGGLAALGFGALQRNTNLPSISGVPDTLVYGTVGTIAGVLMKSQALTHAAQALLFAGLHDVGLNGFGAIPPAGQERQHVERLGQDESVEGEFDGVVAGDFDEL